MIKKYPVYFIAALSSGDKKRTRVQNIYTQQYWQLFEQNKAHISLTDFSMKIRIKGRNLKICIIDTPLSKPKNSFFSDRCKNVKWIESTLSLESSLKLQAIQMYEDLGIQAL